MKAKFDIVINDTGMSPKSITHPIYTAIVRRIGGAKNESIVLVSPYGVLFIDDDGNVTTSNREWFNANFLVIKLVPEVNITFRM